MLANDTNLFLGQNNYMNHMQEILNKWCNTLGAKFNIKKTEIIPLSFTTHRSKVITSCKLNPQDQSPLNDKIKKKAKDEDTVRSLGAWIGNNTNLTDPLEPILDNI